ncbi:hypothetical protein LEP1GSC016_3011 [Leptospira borgpetersenii serovar Hardjo-bovis str. Sponselee]|uniref:Uncharacterized protein n=1 Tax=Leptospira borgpetersenii serovar Hardjo-bovis str. Sponselee TaxID=1303729 RepID=M6BK26_LEPBO|nr:hypothetical protein LEP1GSC016_3011 [Leptospira borgpetersenii serovar Hardjo-bovis str. Sponselee]
MNVSKLFFFEEIRFGENFEMFHYLKTCCIFLSRFRLFRSFESYF